MTIGVKPFEPDTGNTGEGSLKSPNFFGGAAHSLQECAALSFFGETDHSSERFRNYRLIIKKPKGKKKNENKQQQKNEHPCAR